MEKLMVIAGIWALCAMCGVLFIRGATAPSKRRVSLVQVKTGETASRAEP